MKKFRIFYINTEIHLPNVFENIIVSLSLLKCKIKIQNWCAFLNYIICDEIIC